MKPWANKQTGFTIVELLIVVVVIGIIASISVTAYNGLQVKASNSATTSGVAAYMKVLALYAAKENVYPTTSGTYKCLPDSNNSNTCSLAPGDVTNACPGFSNTLSRDTAYEASVASIAGVSSLPKVSSQKGECYGSNYGGAYLAVNAQAKSVTFWIIYKGNLSSCPSIPGLDFAYLYDRPNVSLCAMQSPELP